MKRSERLHAITEYLRRRRTPVTVADLARHFEVDERTVFRDLAALRDQQVPIVGEPGRGGGLQVHRDYRMPPLDAALYRTCERAFISGRALDLEYTDRNGAATTRVVEPHGLLVATPLWYLLAHDRLRGEPRMFRVDRIRGAVLREAARFEPRDPRRMFLEIEAYGLEVRE